MRREAVTLHPNNITAILSDISHYTHMLTFSSNLSITDDAYAALANSIRELAEYKKNKIIKKMSATDTCSCGHQIKSHQTSRRWISRIENYQLTKKCVYCKCIANQTPAYTRRSNRKKNHEC